MDTRTTHTLSISTGRNVVELLAKLEYTNPSGSIKDRVAQRILAHLKAANKIKDSTVLVVPSSGNLAISLALLAPLHGHYKVIGLIPERTSQDRIQLLKSLGVEIVRTPIEAHADSAESQFSIAKKIATDLSDAVLVDEVCIKKRKEKKKDRNGGKS